MKGIRLSGAMIGGIGLILAIITGLILVVRTHSRANIVLITVDTLRADHLSAYGYERKTSPNLDALAKESVLFKQAYSQSSETNPSLSSLMTSAFPFETQVLSNRYQLPSGVHTLSEVLQQHGYQTGAVVGNVSLRRGSGFEQGFDTYDDTMEDVSKTKWEGIERLAPKTTRAAIDWLNAHDRDRFFLWVHYMDPHYPYLPPPPHNAQFVNVSLAEDKWLPFNTERTGVAGIHPAAQLGDHHEWQFYVSQYDGEIRFFDESLGELLQTVRAKGLMDNTLIVLAADHGEGMGEHDYYFAHHEFLYQKLVHVPLIVRFPDQRLAGHVVSYPVANVDVLPTILETLSIVPPNTTRGRNLLSSEPRDVYAVTHYRGGKEMLISGGMKFLVNDDYPGLLGRTELYDLVRDPDERLNLFADLTDKHADAVRSLRNKLAGLKRDDRLGLGAPLEWNLAAESDRKLRALGYVQ